MAKKIIRVMAWSQTHLVEDVSSILCTDQVNSVSWNYELLVVQFDAITSL